MIREIVERLLKKIFVVNSKENFSKHDAMMMPPGELFDTTVGEPIRGGIPIKKGTGGNIPRDDTTGGSNSRGGTTSVGQSPRVDLVNAIITNTPGAILGAILLILAVVLILVLLSTWLWNILLVKNKLMQVNNESIFGSITWYQMFGLFVLSSMFK